MNPPPNPICSHDNRIHTSVAGSTSASSAGCNAVWKVMKKIDRITELGVATEHWDNPRRPEQTLCGVPLDTPGVRVIDATGTARPCWNCKRKRKDIGMTAKQLANEKRTTEAFVDECMALYRPKGADAATTYALLSLFSASAHMAPRRANGSIDRAQAKKILKRAMKLLTAVDPDAIVEANGMT